MKILGIIAEYNPFHSGHAFHLKEALKITNCDAAVIVMSGDFVQRGEPAIFPKHLRAKMALTEGASVVLELPVSYACSSAEYFALGAVTLLNQLGCIDALCFGSETGEIDKLLQIAHFFVDEPSQYQALLQAYLHQGLSFPAARRQAFSDYTKDESLSSILDEPNNILGIEYLKALLKTKSTIRPFTITRRGANYHDCHLHSQFSSASAIRNSLIANEVNSLRSHMPDSTFYYMQEYLSSKGPVECNDFSLLLKCKLLTATKETLCSYADVSEELANRILNTRNQFLSWSEFCDLLKTKELTYSRVSRALLHILLDIKKEDLIKIKSDNHSCYARILGFQKNDSTILKEFKMHSRIPIITKLGNCNLSLDAQTLLEKDCLASNLYESVVTHKYHTEFIEEHSQSLCLL